jgi:adenine-specific DNA-methyltransferase
MIILIKDIDLGKRFRKEYGEVEELAKSIKELGLIQPIAVCKHPKKESKKPYLLLAGGRRLVACSYLGMVEIEANVFEGDIDEYTRKLIELKENTERLSFEWQEEIGLKQRVHQLYTSLYGEKSTTAKGDPEKVGWSKRDTAKLLKASPGAVSQDLLLADALNELPQLKKAKNKKEALLMLNKFQEELIVQELGKRLETGEIKSTVKNDPRKKLVDSYIVGNFYKKQDELPDGCAQLIIADPPYAINLMSTRKDDAHVDKELKPEEYIEHIENLMKILYRIAAPNSWVILWFGLQWYSETKEAIKKAGFDIGPASMGIWAKNNGRTMFPERYLKNYADFFFYARKGDATIAKSIPNILEAPVTSKTRWHKTEKPVDLDKRIIEAFSDPGAFIVVPFAGSGNDLIAADKLKRKAIGFDIDERYKLRFTSVIYGGQAFDESEVEDE